MTKIMRGFNKYLWPAKKNNEAKEVKIKKYPANKK